MVRLLVTGARGFVGSRLVRRLEREGATVVGFDRELDVADAARVHGCVAEARPDAVIHLAALSSVPQARKDPALAYRVNFRGTRSVLEAVRRLAPEARVLVVSTSEVYGRARPDAPPVTESSPLRPASPYASTKAAADLLAGCFAEQGMDVVRVRPFNHTGPGQRDEFAPSAFARQIAEIEAGLKPPTLAVGNLDSVRDFLDVDDVIEAYWRLLDPAVPAGIYNVATGGGLAVRELLEILLSHAQTKPTVTVDRALYRPTDALRGSAQRLQLATGWAPRIPLADTLRRLLEHWREAVARGVQPGFEAPADERGDPRRS